MNHTLRTAADCSIATSRQGYGKLRDHSPRGWGFHRSAGGHEIVLHINDDDGRLGRVDHVDLHLEVSSRCKGTEYGEDLNWIHVLRLTDVPWLFVMTPPDLTLVGPFARSIYPRSSRCCRRPNAIGISRGAHSS